MKISATWKEMSCSGFLSFLAMLLYPCIKWPCMKHKLSLWKAHSTTKEREDWLAKIEMSLYRLGQQVSTDPFYRLCNWD
jgi:hypothetical protein